MQADKTTPVTRKVLTVSKCPFNSRLTMAMEKESFNLLYIFDEKKKKKGKDLSLLLPGNRSIDGVRSIGPDRYLRPGRKDRFEGREKRVSITLYRTT